MFTALYGLNIYIYIYKENFGKLMSLNRVRFNDISR